MGRFEFAPEYRIGPISAEQRAEHLRKVAVFLLVMTVFAVGPPLCVLGLARVLGQTSIVQRYRHLAVPSAPVLVVIAAIALGYPLFSSLEAYRAGYISGV